MTQSEHAYSHISLNHHLQQPRVAESAPETPTPPEFFTHRHRAEPAELPPSGQFSCQSEPHTQIPCGAGNPQNALAKNSPEAGMASSNRPAGSREAESSCTESTFNPRPAATHGITTPYLILLAVYQTVSYCLNIPAMLCKCSPANSRRSPTFTAPIPPQTFLALPQRSIHVHLPGYPLG